MLKASLVQPIVCYVQVNSPWYLFPKLARYQKIFFYILAWHVIQELLLKISVLRKVYTVEPILVKGLNKIAGEIIQSFCFLSLIYSITLRGKEIKPANYYNKFFKLSFTYKHTDAKNKYYEGK